jgi:N-acetylmuramoyl-L-alanine amidase
MHTHIVRQGEQLASIARKYGFNVWRTIYDHSQNSDFMEKRPNPNVIYPGDRIAIPDKEMKLVDAETEQRHRFKRKKDDILLRIVVRQYGNPISNKRYELRIGEKISPTIDQGETNDDGLVKQRISADVQWGELALRGNGSCLEL